MIKGQEKDPGWPDEPVFKKMKRTTLDLLRGDVRRGEIEGMPKGADLECTFTESA